MSARFADAGTKWRDQEKIKTIEFCVFGQYASVFSAIEGCAKHANLEFCDYLREGHVFLTVIFLILKIWQTISMKY
ncbi:hypothetical protein F3147_04740 [Streptococcus agalactiae]|nr:hypothetical protein F3147_04740 [Streptococcus agalactiae]